MLNYFEVSGTDYEMGFQISTYFKDYLNKRIIDFNKKVNLTKEKIDFLKEKMKNNFPNLLQEIYGRADGAQVSRDSLLLMFFPEVYKRLDGCTTVIVKKINSVLFCHNEDNSKFNLENTALIKYNYKNRFVIAYTNAERLAGSAFSYNSYGLVFSCNYIYGGDTNLDNLSRYIVVRDLINSKSIDEVIEKLNKTNVASPFSINILDTNENTVINIEKDIQNLYITNINDKYARSNHFHKKETDLTKLPESTKFRFEKINELIKKVDVNTCTINDLIKILMYHTDDYNKCVYKEYNKFQGKAVTDATYCVNTLNDYLTIYDYIGKSILIIDTKGNLISQNNI